MKLIIVFLLVVLCVGFMLVFFKMRKKTPKVSFGTVIVLNGPSGSGKSSIQKEFQKLMMPNLWIKTGIDDLFDKPMPDITPENMEFWQSSNPIRWVESSKDEAGNSVITLFVGKQGERVAYAMNSAIADYAKNGCNVIVDYIAYKKVWFDDLQEKLKDIKTYYVAVKIPLEVLEKREEARGTSPKGHARSHYFSVYLDKTYDLTVNSHNNCAKEIAQQIKNLII
ncbi:hypothetical protein ACFLYU_04295 [Candidatus Dependentiae bacterium]